MTDDDLAAIPEQHRPVGPVTRSHITAINVRFRDVSNRVEFIFDGSHPEVEWGDD